MTGTISLPQPIQAQIDSFYSGSSKPDCEGNVEYRGGSPRKRECEILAKLVLKLKPSATVDWGLGDAAVAMEMALARRELQHAGKHVSLDPFQHSISKDVGIIQLRSRGLDREVEFREQCSAHFLVHAAEKQRTFDFIFVDGDHSVGAKITDAYLGDSILKPGGVIAFHDSLFESTSIAVTWLIKNRGYELISLVSEPKWKILARAVRHVRRLGFYYVRQVVPVLGVSIAALRKPTS
jgi:predicted O-methyltransferase YrrM